MDFMKFLVTGGLGFIGSNFIKKLFELYPECSIRNVDAGFYGSNKKNLDDVISNEDYEFVHGNISDYQLMDDLISNSDIIINFAAESFVDRSISEAKPFLDSNIRYLYNSGFDPAYNNFSSGLLNHAFAIKRSIEKKYDVFDFMRGNERYKYDLGGIDTQLYTVILEKK